MVNEACCAEAVTLAKENPRLGVGLHLTLLGGPAALAVEKIPGLVDSAGEFATNPVAVGLKYFLRRGLRAQLEMELAAQFEKFHATGLQLDHVNGHLHLHLHPVVFRILMRRAREWGITHLRLTRDSFWFNARLAGGAWLYRASHAMIFGALAVAARGALVKRDIQFVPRVFGLLQNGRVDEGFVTRLLVALPPGDSELYSHPSPAEFKHELDALLSPAVRELIRVQNIELIRYQDL